MKNISPDPGNLANRLLSIIREIKESSPELDEDTFLMHFQAIIKTAVSIAFEGEK